MRQCSVDQGGSSYSGQLAAPFSGVWRALYVGMLILATAGCVGGAAQFADNAAALDWRGRVQMGTQWRHQIYYKPGVESARLHVYLGGDGLPWVARYWVNPEPTLARPLAMQLMAQDRAQALWLGRPCYHGFATERACDKRLWTVQRHSDEVVASMRVALEKELSRRSIKEVVLIGHSGGGALAMLIAAQLPQVRSVVTVAGNLDLDAWVAQHGYSRLQGSLNPARLPALASTIEQFHWLGRDDENIPPALVLPWLRANPQRRYALYSADHLCCWAKNWPNLLAQALGDVHN